MKILTTLIFYCFIFSINAQIVITKKNANDTCLTQLKKYRLKAIAFFSHENYSQSTGEFNLFLALDKKTKKWGVMTSKESWNNSEHEYLVKPEYDSIGDLTNDNSLVVLKKENKYGVIYLNWQSQKIKPTVRFNEVIISEHSHENYVIVRRGKKWGLFQPQFNLLSIPCIYNSKDKVPTYGLTHYDYRLFLEGKKNKGFTGYKPDGNGDGVFYACGSDHKWGLFQSERQIIPMKYDEIESMSWNAPFLIVYNKNKAGIYINPFGDPKMTVSCQYEELKRFKHSGYFGCAVRKGNKWAILDWYTNKLLTGYVYDSFDSITIPYNTKSEYYK